MKLLNRLSVTQERGGPRKFSFEMSMSGLISVGIVVVLGMCWVFILGILVGRGYRPEAAVPQIAQMMPTTETAQPEGAKPAEPPKVLKPEELQFMDGLQGKDGTVVADSTQKSPADGKKAAGLQGHDLPDAKTVPMGTATAATSIPAPPPVPAAAKVVPPAPPRVKAEPAKAKTKAERAATDKKESGRFAATYQVASFKTKEQADTMIKELSRKGLSASLREGSAGNRKLFRVDVRLKGTESEIAAELKRTGEKGPILLGKKPL
ncbi:Sporulation domain protein [Solidesulfovibrio fructosivorans JJ]]|uniref:Sporulation domain protein n=1 Tax=Solidesulfovibrio fructosivorans JJ] TaxID=596151 RepID=E1JYT8_SOLFR|nr:SPOR domain-containing protein [Solidesulfovibrio fructosivorans]EFL50508.1 Sporulation domain protein [Solidesulfovibrio fructosivorans JJ]]